MGASVYRTVAESPCDDDRPHTIPSKEGNPARRCYQSLAGQSLLHYAFDNWMERQCPATPFERYADDAVCHCKSLAQAEYLLRKLNERMENVGLELHPEKTKIVYCKDTDRQKDYALTSFDFLGYTFRARKSKNRWGKFFINFLLLSAIKQQKQFGKPHESGIGPGAVTRAWKI
ncbi:reverse transcriptase domain-containing protein [Desulfobacter postgatei]|uniref:reverse transcriptase domain-containing protein n=1 Tax=Desulfobacter postgatei TaxID=2293 RepID=UPI001FE05A03|nr:reverse transcriptase domain-containing protein [Desulfobacter postgatei]